MTIAGRARSRTIALGLLLAVLALAGCSASSFPELNREPTEQDTLELREGTVGVDMDTTRLAGETDGYTVYLARGAESQGVCLILVNADSGDWHATACGGATGVETRLPTGTRIFADAGPLADREASANGDYRKLSDSVCVISK